MEPHNDEDQERSDAESRVEDTRWEKKQKLEPIVGWSGRLHIKTPVNSPLFHDLLEKTLEYYYTRQQARWEYRCTEHRHPRMGTRWTTELVITCVDVETGIRRMKSKHVPRVSRISAERSMEDAALIALTHYRGEQLPAMRNDGLVHYPRCMPDGTWTVEVAEKPVVLQATVELVRALVTMVGELKDELHHETTLNMQLCEELEQIKKSST